MRKPDTLQVPFKTQPESCGILLQSKQLPKSFMRQLGKCKHWGCNDTKESLLICRTAMLKRKNAFLIFSKYILSVYGQHDQMSRICLKSYSIGGEVTMSCQLL